MTDTPASHHRPPETIPLNQDTVLQRYTADMLVALAAAHAASVDHLTPYMPWAKADPTANALQFLDRTLIAWHSGTAFEYAVLQPATSKILGGMGLMTRQGPHTLEVGYWLREEATGRGLATTGAGALAREAFEFPDVDTLFLLCDESNTRSAAVARRLGFELRGVEDTEKLAPGQTGRTMRWAMTRQTRPME